MRASRIPFVRRGLLDGLGLVDDADWDGRLAGGGMVVMVRLDFCLFKVEKRGQIIMQYVTSSQLKLKEELMNLRMILLWALWTRPSWALDGQGERFNTRVFFAAPRKKVVCSL